MGTNRTYIGDTRLDALDGVVVERHVGDSVHQVEDPRHTSLMQISSFMRCRSLLIMILFIFSAIIYIIFYL